MNGLTLAYIGDAYYELEIRKYLITEGYRKVNDLHNMAVKFTKAVSQAKIINYFIDNNFLSEEEISIFKRGRNNSSSGRKNVLAKDYVLSTGFESLIGHLYLNDKSRADELIKISISFILDGVI